MVTKTRSSLDLLVDQLTFLQTGGYAQRLDGCTPRLLQDSPSCPNFRLHAEDRVPCHECSLMRFVPPDDRDEARPCQHIPLNRAQETLEMLFYWASQDEQKRKLRAWLLQEILLEDSRSRINALRQDTAEAAPNQEHTVTEHESQYRKTRLSAWKNAGNRSSFE